MGNTISAEGEAAVDKELDIHSRAIPRDAGTLSNINNLLPIHGKRLVKHQPRPPNPDETPQTETPQAA